jgi:nucleoside-diphosphate-sugar epimerase
VATLAREGASVVALDLGTDDRRLRQIASEDELAPVRFVRGDITDTEGASRTFAEHGVTHVVHLAALQVPFCKADPVLGAQVNVTGTVNVFEAAKAVGLRTPVVFASSAAVYDAHGRVNPQTLYGVYKLADEGMARVYWEDAGIASIGIRPYSVFGPGRDQGVTAEPTHAMAAAARGESYHLAFGGRTELNYAPDVARGFIEAARAEPDGAEVYEFPGDSIHMSEIVATIERVAPESAGHFTFDDVQLPFPERLPGTRLAAAVTPLDDAVAQTIEHFRSG